MPAKAKKRRTPLTRSELDNIEWGIYLLLHLSEVQETLAAVQK